MINSISKLLLFMLAYLLVIEAVIFTYLYQYSTLFYTILVLVISTALIIGLNKLLIHTLETQKGNPKSVTIIENKNSEYLLFIVSYLIPLITIKADLFYLVLEIIIFIMIFLLYTDSMVIAVNPFLKYFFYYNIYNAKIDNKHSYVLSKNELEECTSDLALVCVARNVWLKK